MSESFIKNYLQFTSDSEVPVCFNRWAAIAGLSIILERNVWVPFGHSNIYPNQYLMLMGSAGTRKSTAIKLIKHILIGAGYSAISAERTSKEKFLSDLAGDADDNTNADDILERNLFGSGGEAGVHPMAIMADEANDFFGSGNLEFLSILGSLWDWQGVPYQNRIKTGKSVSISDPTINIFAGNTPTGFATAFPPEILGQGFFSRLLLVYSEPNGKRIAFPRTPDKGEVGDITRLLQRCRTAFIGELAFTRDARTLLETIYNRSERLHDMRFDAYFNRRFTHLLKLCIITTCANFSGHITESCVIEANTYLSYAESLMPKALGEFGKSRNSDVTHKVLGFIESHDGCTLRDIVKFVGNDLEQPSDIGAILKKLSMAEKIQSSQGIFLPMRRPGLDAKAEFVDLGYLTEEELAVKG